MKWDSHLKSAIKIINSYSGSIPLAAWLKDFFRANKQMGSKDRKSIAAMVYHYYRTAHATDHGMPIEERILISVFLCNQHPLELLDYFKPEWNRHIEATTEEKILLLDPAFKTATIFPFIHSLSTHVDTVSFCASFLQQPKLFIRIRPGYYEKVIRKLDKAAIAYEVRDEHCIAFPNATKLEELLKTDEEVVIQDESSQRTGDLIRTVLYPEGANNSPAKLRVWDACAASGGKSILAYDMNPAIELTVSDIRESVLYNLRQRFLRAGIRQYQSSVMDVSVAQPPGKKRFNIVLADVPCSGSGTWARTPEQLYFFKEEQIDTFSALQKKIVANLVPHIEQQGYLVYITCSVFKAENEAVVEFLQQQYHLQLEAMQLIEGHRRQADTLFVAVLRVPS
jgi:16S rRNA (cytosine967-C5)-methyltransferase